MTPQIVTAEVGVLLVKTSLPHLMTVIYGVACNFNLHLLCCGLPKSFKHDCHQHPLTLKDNFIDLFVDDFEDEEYCCDFCETRRNARECVYHCEKCNFVVDLDCVFSEVCL